MSKTYHPYHLVDPSPWPYIMSCGVFLTTLGAVIYFQYSQIILLLVGFLLVLFCMFLWLKDVVRESTFQGHHTKIAVLGLKLGFLLFIISEILFFFSFFWAFFHSSLSPSVEIGVLWPPVGIDALNPFSVPLLNTVVLLSSGATVTWAHHSIVSGNRKDSIRGLLLTVILGFIFTILQGMEYVEAPFSIADSVYGTTFFVATGFHGLHVIIGTIFLLICLIRLSLSHFTRSHHLGFEAASWYWHFVDVVWLFLYVCIYWWGC
uniref:Cytochrome c oxidase subunit 3 n=1 Tax=Spirocodon saltatrix TaxID=6093 RepID=A0A7D5NLS1_9CNID|nr:cytochrome c oxidase subunit III [Spirocodon saltatrix]QLH56856.1 cytochrome c oxidase subunit III [Spirocodon saltatrix]